MPKKKIPFEVGDEVEWESVSGKKLQGKVTMVGGKQNTIAIEPNYKIKGIRAELIYARPEHFHHYKKVAKKISKKISKKGGPLGLAAILTTYQQAKKK